MLSGCATVERPEKKITEIKWRRWRFVAHHLTWKTSLNLLRISDKTISGKFSAHGVLLKTMTPEHLIKTELVLFSFYHHLIGLAGCAFGPSWGSRMLFGVIKYAQ